MGGADRPAPPVSARCVQTDVVVEEGTASQSYASVAAQSDLVVVCDRGSWWACPAFGWFKSSSCGVEGYSCAWGLLSPFCGRDSVASEAGADGGCSEGGRYSLVGGD